jgi:hypothetical protein
LKNPGPPRPPASARAPSPRHRAGCGLSHPAPRRLAHAADTSTIRGANYCYAEYGGHPGMWNHYSPAITERDLTTPSGWGSTRFAASSLTRPFASNSNQFRQNLLHLVRAADQRGIGVMPVVATACR